MRAKIGVGVRWACLKVVGEEVGEHRIELGPGVAEIRKEVCYVMECKCGGQVKVWKSEWKGQKYVKDCGCGLAARDGAVVLMTVTMPGRVRSELKEFQRKEGIQSFSRAVREVVELGLAYYDNMTGGGK